MAAAACRVILGKTSIIFDGALTGTGETCIDFVLDSADSILVSLYVRSVSAGTVSATLYTKTLDGEEVAIISFPDITAPTTDLLLKKAAVGLSNMKLCISHTGDAEVSVYGKGIAIGEASVRLLGASEIKTSQVDIGNTASVLVPSALTDRAGMVIKNYSLVDTLFVAESLAKAISGTAYPMGPGEAMGVDVAAGVELYGISGGGTIDVRILEANS